MERRLSQPASILSSSGYCWNVQQAPCLGAACSAGSAPWQQQGLAISSRRVVKDAKSLPEPLCNTW